MEKNAIEHHFRIEDAQKYNIEKAILLHNLRFWLERNRANETNKFKYTDGKEYYWTYNSSTAFAKLFPYMKEKSISRWLRELEDDGVLVSGRFNKVKYDKTKWYTIRGEFLVNSSIAQNESLVAQNKTTHYPKTSNQLSQNAQPIPDNKLQIKETNIPPYFPPDGENESVKNFSKLFLQEKESNSLSSGNETKENNYGKSENDEIYDNSADIEEVMSMFENVLNASKERLLSKKTEKKSALRLINKFGKDNFLAMVKQLPDISANTLYCPSIGSPTAFEDKLPSLLQAVNRRRSGGVGNFDKFLETERQKEKEAREAPDRLKREQEEKAKKESETKEQEKKEYKEAEANGKLKEYLLAKKIARIEQTGAVHLNINKDNLNQIKEFLEKQQGDKVLFINGSHCPYRVRYNQQLEQSLNELGAVIS